MKAVVHSLLPLALAGLLAACQTTPPQIIVRTPGVEIPITSQAAVRTPEVVKAYAISRYRDPVDPRIMHEGHVVYRVERTPDFRTYSNYNDRILVGPSLGLRGPGYVQGPIPKELGAELVRQRRATQKATAAVGELNAAAGDIQKNLRDVPVIRTIQESNMAQLDSVAARQRDLEERAKAQDLEIKRLREANAEIERRVAASSAKPSALDALPPPTPTPAKKK